MANRRAALDRRRGKSSGDNKITVGEEQIKKDLRRTQLSKTKK